MGHDTLRVTAEMVRHVNNKRMLAKQTGTQVVSGCDFLGDPIEVSVHFDQDAVRRAWKAVNERFAKA